MSQPFPFKPPGSVPKNGRNSSKLTMSQPFPFKPPGSVPKNQKWQDDFRKALNLDGEAFRARTENFPKLWTAKSLTLGKKSLKLEASGEVVDREKLDIEKKNLARIGFEIFFSPRAGVVYTTTESTAISTTQVVDDEAKFYDLFIPTTSKRINIAERFPIFWSENLVKSRRQSCDLYIPQKHESDKLLQYIHYINLEEIKHPSLKIFSVGSPLREAKLTDTMYGTYSSKDFDFDESFGFASLIPAVIKGITSLFGSSLPYGSAGDDDDVDKDPPESLPCLQGRGELFPKLERIMLENSYREDKEVYEFRESPNKVMFLNKKFERLEQDQLLIDKPSTWYLMEDTQDADAYPYVLGIGQSHARVHMRNKEGYDAAFKIEIIKEKDLFKVNMRSKPLKERSKRSDKSKSNEGSNCITSEKLERVIKELASQVSYKTIRTMLHPVSPGGKDLTMEFFHEVEGKVRKVRQVLYAIGTKYFRFLENSDENYFSHLIGVWADSELVDAYWVRSENQSDTLRVGPPLGVRSGDQSGDRSLFTALTSMHTVKRVMQTGEEIPKLLVRADLDVESPNLYFSNVLGEYGAAFREASLQEFERHKKYCNSDPAFGSSSNIVRSLGVVAEQVALSGLLGETAKNLANGGLISSVAGLFGLSESERWQAGENVTLKIRKRQPYVNVKGVYDQENDSICVICSIGHAISMLNKKDGDAGAPDLELLERILLQLDAVIALDTVPRGGLNITDALNEMAPVLEPKGLTWKKIESTVANIKNALDMGLPVIVGVIFDDQLFTYNTKLDEPISGPWFQAGTQTIPHCVTCIGYDDADSTFTFLNSYGEKWGRNGAMVIAQNYKGFDRAFVLTEVMEMSRFAAVNIPRSGTVSTSLVVGSRRTLSD